MLFTKLFYDLDFEKMLCAVPPAREAPITTKITAIIILESGFIPLTKNVANGVSIGFIRKAMAAVCAPPMRIAAKYAQYPIPLTTTATYIRGIMFAVVIPPVTSIPHTRSIMISITLPIKKDIPD